MRKLPRSVVSFREVRMSTDQRLPDRIVESVHMVRQTGLPGFARLPGRGRPSVRGHRRSDYFHRVFPVHPSLAFKLES